MLEFTVHARPAPQGSKRPRVSKSGKPYMIESSAAGVKSYRGAVVESAELAIGDATGEQAEKWEPMEGPVLLYVVFTFARPTSHYGTGKNRRRLKPTAPARPATRATGDLSHLVRATEDAITDAGVWKDDCQVVECFSAAVYPGGHQHAQRVPGAWISIAELGVFA